jgi:glycosyltransferase involved in cell wall biosynthesis
VVDRLVRPSGISSDGIVVSIVTPTLNQSAFLEQTIRSIRAQSYPLVEHIVIDGGSTDGTLDILRRHTDLYDLRWFSEPDSGMYSAVNKGMRIARGAICSYLNSDDLMLPWAVEAAVEAFARDPDIDVVYGDAIRWYEEIQAFDLVLQARFRLGRVGRTGSLVQPTVFWRRRLADRLSGFDERLRLAADLDYWLRAGQTARFEQVEEVFAIERVHAGGQSTRLQRDHSREGAIVRGRHVADGRLRLPRKLLARLLNGAATRRRMLGFVKASVSDGDPRWVRFRAAAEPRISALGLLVALVTPRPLSGTPVHSLQMRLLRGRWIRIAPAMLRPGVERADE